MAAIPSAHGDPTALTPPSSSKGDETSWAHSWQQSELPPEQTLHEKNGAAHLGRQTHRSPVIHQNGNPSTASHKSSLEVTARKMHSADNLHGARGDKAAEDGAPPSSFTAESRMDRSTLADSSQSHRTSREDLKRPVHQSSDPSVGKDNSKWIHRDKLAKIENEELQAAGFVVPRPRAPSKQRRERSVRRGTNASEHIHNRPNNDPATLETSEVSVQLSTPVWDFRTPEEIAEEQENAYFSSQGPPKGGSRIPVAKVSPAPIPVDYLERGSTATRHSPEGEMITHTKTRSRSASATLRDPASTTPSSGPRTGQRPAADASPKKSGAAARKISASSKPTTTTGKPKTRSSPNKDSPSANGIRPQTRSGEPASSNKQLEGDPPWLINSYKPDPRLPPDQQLIPTVARRLQQEKWEREGKFGDIYDKEFRPLNDHLLVKLPETENGPSEEANQEQDQNQNQNQNQNENENQENSDNWPLKAEVAKSPTPRQGSYSTMPKIPDQTPKGPLPATPILPQTASQQQQAQQREKVQAPQPVPNVTDEDEKKSGCGCCVVM